MSSGALGDTIAELPQKEARLIERIKNRERIAKNVNVIEQARLTFGQRIADQLAVVAGSWGFIISFLVVLVLWLSINSYILISRPFDPYPFILLNLVLSCLAAIQAPVILMSENRQAARDRLHAEHDYEVNVKAEMEIEALHEKLDLLREKQWTELVEMQQRQIGYLERLIGSMPSGPAEAPR